MDAALHLRLFGPTALWRGAAPVALRSRKAMLLLALLALDGAQAREALAVLLWPDQDPPSARRNLRRELFRLRQLGVAFDDGDPLRLALSTTLEVSDDGTGPPLAWLDGTGSAALEDWLDDWLRDRRSRIVARRRRRQLATAERYVQQGDPSAALGLWTALLDADPCDEDALAAALRALAAAGQPARALALYGRSAASMRERMGIEPSLVLRQLAASLRAPAPLARPSHALFAERLPFVPRAAAAASILRAWERRQPVWLSGESGAGKTLLAAECAAAHGPWLKVDCLPSDRGLPYASVVRLLRALRAAAPDVVLPDWVLREVACLLPELGPAPVHSATGEAHARLLAGVDRALALLSAGNFSVLVLDDWQWADDASAEIWNTLDTATLPLALLMSFRTAQLPPAALAQLRRETDAARAVGVELRGFDADETLALTHALSTSPGGRLFSQRLQQATAGNPFFLIETLRHLHQQGLLHVDDQGRWSTPFDRDTHDYAELPVAPTVRDAVLARVRALGATAETVLAAASLHDGTLDGPLLSEVTGLDAHEVHAALEHGGAARLLTDRGGAWDFAHDLVRQCLVEAQPLRRRRHAHRALAAALDRRGADPARLAHHHEQAGDARRAVAHRLRAGDAAWAVHALAQAAAQWRAALADGPAPEQAVQAWLSLAGLHRREADPRAATAAVDAALTAAAQAGPDVRLHARLACAELWVAARRADAAEPLLAALAADLAVASPRQRARALGLRATLAGWGGRTDDAVRLYEQAFEVLRDVPETLVMLGDMLDSAARCLVGVGRAAEARGYARRAVATLEAAGAAGLAELAGARVIEGVCALYAQGDTATALDCFERARALARRCGLVPVQRSAILNLIKLHTDGGRSDEALALLAEGEALAPGYEHVAAEQAFLQARYYIHYLRGEIADAEAAADRLVAMARHVSEGHVLVDSLFMVADLSLLGGRLDRAASLLAEAQALADADPGHGAATMIATKRAWLALERGDTAQARALLPEAGTIRRDEARPLRAWVAAALSLAEGDGAAAQRTLQEFGPDCEAPTDTLAMLLVQHLRVARVTAGDAAAAAARARALLAAGAVPALEAARLRAALEACGGSSINGRSTPPA